MKDVFSVRGLNGQIEFDGRNVRILRKGFLAKFSQGIKGEKSIPIRMISSLQFKKATIFANGYVQFATGAGEARSGLHEALRDENSVVFTISSNDAFEQMRRLLQDALDMPHSVPNGETAAEAIRGLKGLLDEGLITPKEYEDKRLKILGSI